MQAVTNLTKIKKERRIATVTFSKDCRLSDDLELLKRNLLIELRTKLGNHTWNVERVEITV